MRKGKTILTTLLASAVMTLGLAACGGDSADPGSAAGGAGTDAAISSDSSEVVYDQVVYAYATFNNIPSEEALNEVEEAINVITREKIQAEITLKPISIVEYSSKVSLALQGGEKLDVFQSIGDFNNCVSTDMAYDITELLDQYAPETKELIGAEWLAACTKDGKLYGIPTYKPVALTPMVVYREDIAEELELDMKGISSIEDITSILKQVKAAYPDMIPMAAVQTGEIGLAMNYGDIDFLTDDLYKPIGVLLNDKMTVTDLYSTDLFKARCEMARSWYNEDLVMKDAATTTSLAAELMSSGNYFCYIAAYSYPEEDTAASIEAQVGGYQLGAKMLGDAYLSTSDINALSWMVSSLSDVPEAAMKFLNMTFVDDDVINLIIYGKEGRDYVMGDDGTVSYPEGQDATTVPYTAQLSCGTLGNFFKMYPMQGTDPASLEWELEQNKAAKTSPAMGFTFDSSSLKTQYTAVLNVISQYLPGLTCGSLDPETGIPKFVQALEDAGYLDILAEKQKQLDVWAQ
jgi:putative aldouronate transport system substrate-binding protein